MSLSPDRVKELRIKRAPQCEFTLRGKWFPSSGKSPDSSIGGAGKRVDLTKHTAANLHKRGDLSHG